MLLATSLLPLWAALGQPPPPPPCSSQTSMPPILLASRVGGYDLRHRRIMRNEPVYPLKMQFDESERQKKGYIISGFNHLRASPTGATAESFRQSIQMNILAAVKYKHFYLSLGFGREF